MGSHVDTPEWQSFERRMRERYLARRRRMRMRWMSATAGAILFGVSVGPPRVNRQTVTPASRRDRTAQAQAVAPRSSAPAVDVQRVPFSPARISEGAPAAPTSTALRAAAFLSPPPPLDIPGSEPLPPELPPVTAFNAKEEEEQDVRNVIQRYRNAYERLDAAAVQAVWPGTDEAALGRAFDGLTSQRIELERCDIWRDAQAALAACAGRASYVPKVGNAQSGVPREWHFRLRRRSTGWVIESAEAR